MRFAPFIVILAVLLLLCAFVAAYILNSPVMREGPPAAPASTWDTRSIVCVGSEATSGGRRFFLRNVTASDYRIPAPPMILVCRKTDLGIVADPAIQIEQAFLPAQESTGVKVIGQGKAFVAFDLVQRRRIELK
jgi:hypothetical protein